VWVVVVAAARFVKLDSGVRYQVLREGKGEGAAAGDSVEFDYVLRRANGYFIYS
jgi:FKBP-type peptidyl-prolyl cis-trans isomerase